MIKILTTPRKKTDDFLLDQLIDFWTDVKKANNSNVSFIEKKKSKYRFENLLYKGIEKLPFTIQFPKLYFWKKPPTVFALIIGPDFSQFLRYRLKGYNIVFMMMDAWPTNHPRIVKAIKMFGVETVFFTSKQVSEIFKQKGILQNSLWMPEAIKIEEYYAKPMNERKIDVLSFGRKWELHHEKIFKELEENKINYWYEKIKGVPILTNRKSFVDAVADAKITICVPSDITHPLRAGNISTITWRYFQCMAAKTVVLGMAPAEMIEFLGYNPVIEIDIENPVEQIKSILLNIDAYKELIEKNYQTVKNNNTWYHRWLKIHEFFELQYK